MDRRRFLMGLGAFAGAALVLPEVPRVVFDMGRARMALPTMWDADILKRLLPQLPLLREVPYINPNVGRAIQFKQLNTLTVYPEWGVGGELQQVTTTLAQYGHWVRLSDDVPKLSVWDGSELTVDNFRRALNVRIDQSIA